MRLSFSLRTWLRFSNVQAERSCSACKIEWFRYIVVGRRQFWLFVLAGGPPYILCTYLIYHLYTLCIHTYMYIFGGPPAMSKTRPPTTMFRYQIQIKRFVDSFIHKYHIYSKIKHDRRNLTDVLAETKSPTVTQSLRTCAVTRQVQEAKRGANAERQCQLNTSTDLHSTTLARTTAAHPRGRSLNHLKDVSHGMELDRAIVKRMTHPSLYHR